MTAEVLVEVLLPDLLCVEGVLAVQLGLWVSFSRYRLDDVLIDLLGRDISLPCLVLGVLRRVLRLNVDLDRVIL